jgi:hypothetical protein
MVLLNQPHPRPPLVSVYTDRRFCQHAAPMSPAHKWANHLTLHIASASLGKSRISLWIPIMAIPVTTPTGNPIHWSKGQHLKMIRFSGPSQKMNPKNDQILRSITPYCIQYPNARTFYRAVHARYTVRRIEESNTPSLNMSPSLSPTISILVHVVCVLLRTGLLCVSRLSKVRWKGQCLKLFTSLPVSIFNVHKAPLRSRQRPFYE